MKLQRRLFPTSLSVALSLAMLASTVVVARDPATAGSAGASGFRVLSGNSARDFQLPSDVRLVITWRDAPHGLTYTRYQQYATGNVPLDGAQLTLVQRAGRIVLVAGAHFPAVVRTNRLVIDSAGAITRAVAAPAVQGAPSLREVPAPALESRAQLMLDPTGGRLFHRVESGAPGVYVIHDVDAETGAIVAAWNALDNATPGMGTGARGDRKSLLGEEPNPTDNLTSQVSTNWRMESADGRMITMDAGGNDFYYSGTPVMTDKSKAKWKNDNDWAATYQRAAVDAQYYARVTDDWYLDPSNVGGFDFVATDCVGIDPALGTIRNVVHYDEPPFTGYVNAFWDGFSKFMVYGDGDGVSSTYMSGSQDVVSHELTHAVTQCRAPLVYSGQSGALNEAISDIVATAVEWQLDEPLSSNCRREVGQHACPDWWVGEDVLTAGPDFGFRSIADPEVTDQPSHWDDRYCTASQCPDRGGVHYNSTIVSHAFYLLVNGGRNARCSGPADPHAGCNVVVPAIPLADATQIFFSAWGTLTTNASFCDAHAATTATAQVLFPGSNLHQAAADLAWSAVGRGSSDCPPASADFAVGVSQPSIALAPGGQGSVTVDLARDGSFVAPVDYDVSGGSPATSTLTPGESMEPGPDDTALLEITVPAEMAEGVYPLVVSATGGGKTHYAGLILAVDASAPLVSVVGVRFTDGGTVSNANPGTVPLSVIWSAADATSGVTSSTLERSAAGTAPWAFVSSAIGGSSSPTIVGDTQQWFRVSATDAVGNAASPLVSGPWGIGRFQQTAATFTGSWPTASSSSSWGGSLRYATAAGATARFVFTGTDVAWISTRANNRGRAKVYIDGVLKAKVDLFAAVTPASAQARRIVFTATGLSAGPHTLRILVSGTSGRPRVDVDGIVTVSPPAP